MSGSQKSAMASMKTNLGDVPLTLALSLRGRGNRRHGIELLRGWAALVGAVLVEDLTDFAGFRVITERLKYSSG